MGKLFDKIRRVQDKTRPFCSAIVPAAGSSARMGGQDKLLTDLCGAPVLMRTLCAIDRTELVDEIIVATREELLLTVADLCGRVREVPACCQIADDLCALLGEQEI